MTKEGESEREGDQDIEIDGKHQEVKRKLEQMSLKETSICEQPLLCFLPSHDVLTMMMAADIPYLI